MANVQNDFESDLERIFFMNRIFLFLKRLPIIFFGIPMLHCFGSELAWLVLWILLNSRPGPLIPMRYLMVDVSNLVFRKKVRTFFFLENLHEWICFPLWKYFFFSKDCLKHSEDCSLLRGRLNILLNIWIQLFILKHNKLSNTF